MKLYDMNTKHTPGPWECIDDNGRLFVRTTARHLSICSNIGPKGFSGEQHDENDANARLIAASPDMYAILEDIAGVLQVADSLEIPPSIKSVRRMLRKARKVIQLVKGGDTE